MQCLSEETIEIAVLREIQNKYSEEEVRTHIALCTHCRELYESMRNYYTTVLQINDASFSNLESEFYHSVAHTAERKIKKATPVVFDDSGIQTERNDHSANSSVTVLAAETTYLQERQEYKNVAVLNTPAQDILIRILQHKKTGQLTAYLLSHEEEKYSFVLALLEGAPEPYSSDRWGKIDLSDPPSAFPENPQLTILLPLAVFDLSTNSIANTTGKNAGDSFILQAEDSHATLQVRITESGSEISIDDSLTGVTPDYCMIIHHRDETEVSKFRNRTALIQSITLSDCAEIRLFEQGKE